MLVFLDELKADLCNTMKELYEEKILTDIGGNLSFKSPVDDTVWISPSGIRKNLVEPEHLVQLSLDGEILHDNTGSGPSMEYPMHLAVYINHVNAHVVIHSHPPFATAYSLLKSPPLIPTLTYELTFLIPEIITAPYRPAGSEDLAIVVSDSLFACGIAILENHGVVVLSETFRKAAIKTRALEEYLQLYLRAKQFGGKIREFSGASKSAEPNLAIYRFAEQVTKKAMDHVWVGNTLKFGE
ncbi:MAG: class II aldolase/adducin family protein [Candidatus Hodarchaeales archaeon]|jgi:L-fuculose-phosphate aldolase